MCPISKVWYTFLIGHCIVDTGSATSGAGETLGEL